MERRGFSKPLCDGIFGDHRFHSEFHSADQTQGQGRTAAWRTVRLDPPSADGFYTNHSVVKSWAEPAEGFSFERWRDSAGRGQGDSTNPRLSTVDHGGGALFTQQPLTTLATNAPGGEVLVDGDWATLPAAFAWEAGSTHTLDLWDIPNFSVIQFVGDGRLVFNGWSDGGGHPHDITVSGEPTTITADFKKQVLLEADVLGPGTIAVDPSGLEVPGVDCGFLCGREHTYHEPFSTVQLTAQPASGFEFVSWIGGLIGN